MDKRKITLTVIAIAVLLVVLVGSTYAYWTLNGTPKTSANVQVQTGGLILRLDDTEGSITTNDVIDPNHLSFSKYFNITNESAADGYAKVLFKGLTNTFVTDALVYDLEEVQANKTSFSEPRMIITNEVVPKVNNSNATLADGLLIEKGTLSGNTVTPNTKYYKLTVRYNYSDTVNQSDDLNKTLVSGFTLEEGQSSVSMTVSFNTLRSGVTNPESRTLAYGNEYGELPIVVDGDYFTESWYTDSLLTEKVESNSKALKSKNHTLYANWEKAVRCIDDNGKTMTCPATLTIGQRVAVGNEIFRYLRTTSNDVNTKLNECSNGNTDSIACTDTDSRNNIGDNKLRLLAEYNLKSSYDSSKDNSKNNAQKYISSNSIQDKLNTADYANSVRYDYSSRSYIDSEIVTYVNNYSSFLSNNFGISLSGDLINMYELDYLGCDNANNNCNSAPNWLKNLTFWSRSPWTNSRNNNDIWMWVYDSKVRVFGGSGQYSEIYYGVRPVIMISETDFNHYR